MTCLPLSAGLSVNPAQETEADWGFVKLIRPSWCVHAFRIVQQKRKNSGQLLTSLPSSIFRSLTSTKARSGYPEISLLESTDFSSVPWVRGGGSTRGGRLTAQPRALDLDREVESQALAPQAKS